MRDEVFDYAASGKIDFNHPSYITLRNLMNGYIRYSHRISLLNVGIVMILTKLFNRNYQVKSFEDVWQEAVQDLNSETKKEMSQFRIRAEMNLFYYLFLSSLFKKFVAIPMLLAVTVKFFFRQNLKADKEFQLYAYENTAERSPQVKHSIEYINEDAYWEGRLQTA